MQTGWINGLSPKGFHKLFVRIYGNPTSEKVIIAAHGLTRNSSDFHFLAQALEEDYCIYAMDMPGRGSSDDFQDPMLYNFPQYLSDLNNLIAYTRAKEITWLGTSMGGLLGMILASQENTPIKALILNDVGPLIPPEALERIKTYAGIKITFANRQEADMVLKEIFKPFNIQDPAKWNFFMDHTVKKTPEGGLTMAYDPNIVFGLGGANAGTATPAPFNLGDFWNFWDKVQCPVLVLNGATSDILPPDLVQEMKKHAVPFDYFKIPGVGHAPTLFEDDQIQLIKDWLTNLDAETSSA